MRNLNRFILIFIVFIAYFPLAYIAEAKEAFCIYGGKSTAKLSVGNLKNQMTYLYPDAETEVSESPKKFLECINSAKQNKYHITIVIPGGNMVLMLGEFGSDMEDIKKTIKETVEKDGGSYLGICAGGMYACDKLEMDTHSGKCEIPGSMLLQFLKSTAKFPSHKDMKRGITEERAVTNLFPGLNGQVVQQNDQVHVNDSGRYSEESDTSAQVLQRFGADAIDAYAPSIIYKNIGRGKVVTCAGHVEFRPISGCDKRENLLIKILKLLIPAKEVVDLYNVAQ